MQEYRERIEMLQTLQVGSEIGVYGWSGSIQQVVKIRRYKGEARQFELTNGIKFDRTGCKVSNFRGRNDPCMMSIADMQELVARDQARHHTNSKMAALVEEIAKHKCGNGDYHIDADDREALLKIVISL